MAHRGAGSSRARPQGRRPFERVHPDGRIDVFTVKAWDTYQRLKPRLRGSGGSFVYFVCERHTEDSPVKIGSAVDPCTRAYTLQIGNPRQLEIRQVVVGDADLETHLQGLWPEALVRGEWFGNGYQDALLGLADHIAGLQLEGRWRDARLAVEA